MTVTDPLRNRGRPTGESLEETPDRVEGLRAVVTGSTRGLGEAIARELVTHGARVVVNGRDGARCASLASELDGHGVAGSVAEEATADALIACCVDAYGGVDLLVNNAGATADGVLVKLGTEAFDEVVDVHLRGSWLASRAAARAMRSTGSSIVNVVSGTALFGNVGQSTYAAAKGGLLGLTRALSLELARARIRVNAISPIARTEMVEPLMLLGGERRGELEAMFGDPRDVAAVVAWLGSSAAAGITGQVLGFDGRELTVWSHPTPLRRISRESSWTTADFTDAIGEGELAQLHPDALGIVVQELLGVR